MTPEETAALKRRGDRIRTRRISLGMRRKQLAEQIGMSYDYVAGLENGHKRGAPETLVAIARALRRDRPETGEGQAGPGADREPHVTPRAEQARTTAHAAPKERSQVMTSPLWMTAKQVAEESGRHHETVLLALRRQLLTGTQSHPKASWRISRKAFEAWMKKGAPVDAPAKARLRRAS